MHMCMWRGGGGRGVVFCMSDGETDFRLLFLSQPIFVADAQNLECRATAKLCFEFLLIFL